MDRMEPKANIDDPKEWDAWMEFDDPPATDAAPPSSLWRDALKRFLKNKTAVAALAMLVLMVACALFANVLTPYGPYDTELSQVKVGPGSGHLLGSDENGRDILTRILFGARISLTVGFISVMISTIIGSIIGLVSSYYGGWADIILSRVMEMIAAFPSILLAIIFMSIFGRGIQNAVVAIAIVSIPGAARLIRSVSLSVKENDYITSARAIGCGSARIMLRHMLPNILAPIIVNATMSVSGAILSLASLGFLGLGVQPPTAEWGYMLSSGRNYIFSASHIITFPGIAIALTVLSFNLLGDGLRDALDPRLK
ncbi:MAG: ABC transporter permease [Oscillospiraceae bacterium]|jgi:peptide/nickel transport system permease protein/oligopeptide transport system permease protein|nr:ABC transporter permease [Oscillospiraceae bacterium]